MLRDADGLKFEMCMDVCGVDYLSHGRDGMEYQDRDVLGL